MCFLVSASFPGSAVVVWLLILMIPSKWLLILRLLLTQQLSNQTKFR